ncbi:dual specificity protein kinase kns1, partial [Lobosporangium transversale]
KIIRLLGQGTFGKVVECFDRETGKHCAIKIIRAVQKYREASKIEARVLDTLKQHDPQNRYRSMTGLKTMRSALFHPIKSSISHDNCSIVSHKSASKTRRILLDPEIRLIDFGSATFQNEHHSTIVSTRHYRAPEIILGLGWSYPCDIWSIGCILVEFLTGEALFQTHDNLEHLAMMQAVLGPIPDKLIRASHKSSQKYFVHGRLDYPNDETKRN